MLKMTKEKLLKLTLVLVESPLKVKEWLLRRIIPQEENHLGRDTIVTILDQDGNQDIGLVELGK
jgi:hypothetical protein